MKGLTMFLRLLFLAVILVIIVLCSSCLFFLVKILYVRRKYRHLPCPKKRSFIWGHEPEIAEVAREGGHFSMVLVKWQKTYGSVFAMHIFDKASVVCMEPSVVRELLINTKTSKPYKFYGVFQNACGKRVGGNGLFSELDNKRWEQNRKMISPPFKRGYLIDLMYQYNNSVDELITYLRPKADGKTEILMADEFNKVAMDIIAKVAFGLNDLNVISNGDAPFCKAATQTLTGVMAQIRNPFIRFDPREASRNTMRKTQDAIDLIRKIGKNCILERLADMNEGRDYPKDILTHILQASSGLKGNFGLEQMIDEFVTFFVAGQETTAQLMSFTYEIVGRHPDIYKKLQEEVDAVIGDNDSITYENTCKLEYMNLVLKEVLRWAPPAAGVQRRVDRDFVVNGYKIPAGARVGLNHYALGRDERFWDNPEKFDPERFREENNRRLYAYFPFSLGPRVCIGQHFAMIEAKVIIAKLLQKFDFTLVPGVELEYLAEVTLKPKHRTPLYLTPRKTSRD
ncbi:cholesterol 24-hydroxylase-like [Apostichopus japonicus]|uniref:cholesterol 24-hydroxylase-like n=1 Tax=Stichopus japonicus TaxID=307972 RepID=UPI003AB4C7BF